MCNKLIEMCVQKWGTTVNYNKTNQVTILMMTRWLYLDDYTEPNNLQIDVNFTTMVERFSILNQNKCNKI